MSKKQNAIASKNANEKKETANKTTSKAVAKNPIIKKVTDLDVIKKQLEELKKENEELRKGKLKLSFEDAEKMYLKKAELIKDLNMYLQKKEDIESLILESQEDGVLDYNNYKLTFSTNSNYKSEKIITTTNKLIIKEFIPFIIKKLEIKITELKKEVETFEI